MRKLTLMLFVAATALGSMAQPGFAFPQFHKEFVKLYITEDVKQVEGTAEKPSFAELVTGSKSKCFVCHQGKKKKNRNAYGAELGKLLTKKDKKDTKKILESLEKVSKLRTDPKDEKSPTYGDLIKAGNLPGGSLEDAKKEPKAGSDKKGSDKKGSDKK